MRLLHAGIRDGRGVAAGRVPRSERRRDPAGAGGKSLPLHRLPQHRRSDSSRGGGWPVIPAAFDYVVAQSVDHAIEILRGGADAKLLAGGHSLVPAMRLRFARPELLVDLGRLTELRAVRDDGDRLAI